VYALKRILLADKKGAEAAKREVQFLKDIPRHRAVVELVASEVSSKEALLLFEYCGGGSVYSLIERRLEQGRPLGEDEVWAVYHAACEAVEHLHSQQPPVIHRDLKGTQFLLCLRCRV
jgi:serine/threonine protein kinase